MSYIIIIIYVFVINEEFAIDRVIASAVLINLSDGCVCIQRTDVEMSMKEIHGCEMLLVFAKAAAGDQRIIRSLPG